MKYALSDFMEMLAHGDAHALMEALSASHMTYIEGALHAGKTTALIQLAEQLKQAGYTVGGIVQTPIFVAGKRSAYWFQQVATGAVHPFAKRLDVGLGRQEGFGYAFDEHAWEWAEACLARDSQICDVVLVDEWGRLEEQGKGFAPIIQRHLPQSSCLWVCSKRHFS